VGADDLPRPGAIRFAYLVGYASVSLFASTLRVSVADLGLDLRDYVLLTGLTAVSWLPAVAGLALVATMASKGGWGEAGGWRARVTAYVGLRGGMLVVAVSFVAQVADGGDRRQAGRVLEPWKRLDV
jgi:hypothetical protein